MRFLSPLRYPGGKGRLAPYIAHLIAVQPSRPTSYAEPFAGGAGAALRLLIDGALVAAHATRSAKPAIVARRAAANLLKAAR